MDLLFSPLVLTCVGLLATLLILFSYFTYFIHWEEVRDFPGVLMFLSGVTSLMAVTGGVRAWMVTDLDMMTRISFSLAGFFAFTFFAFFLFFIFKMSALPHPRDAQKAEGEAPDFELPDTTGKMRSLSDYKGEKRVLLVFYRGQW